MTGKGKDEGGRMKDDLLLRVKDEGGRMNDEWRPRFAQKAKARRTRRILP